jgi:hypothetical protein
MGELCGSCGIGRAIFGPSKVRRCPGEWFVDTANGQEISACGLLKGVVLIEHAAPSPGSDPRTRPEIVVRDIPNPFYDLNNE